MKKKLLMLFLGTFLLAMQVMAQQVTVTGKITSSEDGLPIPGASVKIKGTNTAVQTSTAGIYTIKANPGDVLQFIYLGLSTREQTVTASGGTINIILNPDSKALNEVVVTAQGIERTKRSLGYDAQSISGAEVASTQRENFINGLQGRVAGVTITPTNGTPGASSSIIIRGAVSLDGDNQPLFVIDGLPVANNTFSEYNLVGQGTFNRQNDYGNRGMDINPDEIETITILKGPEASALYGTQGASGAVVITTKKAKAGTASVTYNNVFRFDKAYRFPDVQTVYGGGAGGIFDEEIRTRTFFGARYPERLQRYDNLGSFYQTGFTQRHNAAVSGGTEALSVRASVGYTDQTGVIDGTDYNKIEARLSGVSRISPKLSMQASFNFNSTKTNKTFKGASSPMLSVLTWPVVDDIRNRYTATGNRRTITGLLGAELDNPLWAMENNPNNDQVSRVTGNYGLDYKPTNWLSFIMRAGLDVYTLQGLSGYHPEAYGANIAGSYTGGGMNTFSNSKVLYNGSFVASAKKTYGKFSANVNLGYDINDDRDQTTAQFGSRFYQSGFFSLNNTDPTTQRVQYTDIYKRKMGVFAQALLGYDDMLYLSFIGRQDYSSTLSPGNVGFFYPATSLSFVFSELPVFKKMNWLSEGKFRASWGQGGKDARQAYVKKTRLIAQTTTGGGFATDVTLGNPDLAAEFTTTSEFGMDLAFLKNRLSANFSYYFIESDGQITAPRLSYATGAILAYINSGLIKNRGFELTVKGTPILKKDFSWTITANLTRARGELISLPGGQETFYLSDSWLAGNVRKQYFVGSSVSALGGNDYLRNNKGDLLINPVNGMPVVDTNFNPLGDAAPDFGLGINNSFNYKNFSLSFLLDIRKGGDIYNATEAYLYARGMSTLTLDREEPRIITGVMRDGLENSANPTPNNIVVIPYITTSYYSTFLNPRDFIEKDINWVRLKDVTVRYNLPKTVFANSKVFKSASIFATGTDLLLLTNYKGVDPSVNGLSAASGGTGGSGIDFGSFGLPRTYAFGINVAF
ncbi:SusC/RagA family TonB-linked outer membrane protein [Pedobacter cryotolerans]|uniref:SusC/RagA family TonB-linked outer membrane protein n=1 Tax=Pedobacter cryotolerans TaxID=2571270 RepID=A0A4U1C8R8_9SPHI|nr:SusC/RagA family TonB-linked outer membrane protein [Pedobacter cryotolerans]TKC02018.1 SusC/RagA family TonB-linked outer membrane protein [Pedobacter cryotolerans]